MCMSLYYAVCVRVMDMHTQEHGDHAAQWQICVPGHHQDPTAPGDEEMVCLACILQHVEEENQLTVQKEQALLTLRPFFAEQNVLKNLKIF